ncbi:hypothetical protein R0K18_28560, partial [Pantoea sp. SIMBA_133]
VTALDLSTISQLSFPAFISKNGIIFSTNDAFRSIINDAEEQSVEEIFDSIEEHETFTITQYKDTRMLFITDQKDQFVYYIGKENTHFSDL